jgi:hypothetical protein
VPSCGARVGLTCAGVNAGPQQDLEVIERHPINWAATVKGPVVIRPVVIRIRGGVGVGFTSKEVKVIAGTS